MSDVVLYRCPTLTDVLCPCGAVSRKLRKLGIEHRTERVPYRQAHRPEIVELTRQRRVPALIDGEEVIHDSKRIIEYLERSHGERRAGPRRQASNEAEGERSDGGKGKGEPAGLS